MLSPDFYLMLLPAHDIDAPKVCLMKSLTPTQQQLGVMAVIEDMCIPKYLHILQLN